MRSAVTDSFRDASTPHDHATRRFHPTFTSQDELLHAFADALHRRDATALRALLVSEREFNDWLWPEFPMSDPAMNVPEGFAWNNLAVKSDKGLRALLRQHGGTRLQVRGVRFTEAEDRYAGFTLLGGTRIDATNADGREWEISRAGSIVVLNGTFKFLSYRE